jgi:hypothetical protein
MQLLCGHAEIYETAQPNNQTFEAKNGKRSNIQYPIDALARWKSKRPTTKHWTPTTHKVSIGAACSPI